MTTARYGRRLGIVVLASAVTIAGVAAAGGTGSAGSLAQATTAQPKVTLCHKGKVTITVAAVAWPVHRDRHGDVMGACAGGAAKTKKAKPDTSARGHNGAKGQHGEKGKTGSDEDEADEDEADDES